MLPCGRVYICAYNAHHVVFLGSTQHSDAQNYHQLLWHRSHSEEHRRGTTICQQGTIRCSSSVGTSSQTTTQGQLKCKKMRSTWGRCKNHSYSTGANMSFNSFRAITSSIPTRTRPVKTVTTLREAKSYTASTRGLSCVYSSSQYRCNFQSEITFIISKAVEEHC